MINQMEPADTRTRILDAAMRLFHEQGFHATGISTILREADVNAGSLYHFFPSKEALLIGVLERYRDMLLPIVMAPAEAASADPIERVFALLQWYRTNLLAIEFRMGCPIGNLALEVSDAYPEIRALIDLNFTNWMLAVKRWLDAAAGRLPKDLDREGLARFVLTVMEGGLMQSRAARSAEPYDRAVRQLRDYVDRLLASALASSPKSKVRKPASKAGRKVR